MHFMKSQWKTVVKDSLNSFLFYLESLLQFQRNKSNGIFGKMLKDRSSVTLLKFRFYSKRSSNV